MFYEATQITLLMHISNADNFMLCHSNADVYKNYNNLPQMFDNIPRFA